MLRLKQHGCCFYTDDTEKYLPDTDNTWYWYWGIDVLAGIGIGIENPSFPGIGIGIGIEKLILQELVLVLTLKGIHPQTCSRYPNGAYKP